MKGTMFLIDENELKKMLAEAFDRGYSGYLDLKEETVEGIIKAHPLVDVNTPQIQTGPPPPARCAGGPEDGLYFATGGGNVFTSPDTNNNTLNWYQPPVGQFNANP